MLDALAAGTAVLPDVVVEHKRNCVSCAAYYESQASFFRGLEEGIKALANEEVPRSLVPGVRARLNDELPLRSSWMSAWGLTAAAAAILVLGFGLLLDRPPYQGVPRENERVASQQVEKSSPVVQPTKEIPSANHRGRQGRRTPAAVAKAPEAVPELIVLPEERAAFARFVANGQEQGVVLAVTRVAPSNEDVPLQIAVLEIHELEVQSLDPSWE
jgi:hypothetical protein